VLDFGCGHGDVVRAGRAEGIEIFGADLPRREDLHDDPSYLAMLGDTIREVHDGRLDFPDATFDLVTANQVFEHVEDPDAALDELCRVLKTNGRMLALFPTKAVIREGHIGIPMAHWFGPGRARTVYTVGLRHLGAGNDAWGNGTLDPATWTQTTLRWLDERTTYRWKREALRPFRERFRRLEFIEDDYVAFRLGERRARALNIPFARAASRITMHALSGMVFVAER
jgi:SAM-dependent methyltransferase